jgi:hypothetical protein
MATSYNQSPLKNCDTSTYESLTLTQSIQSLKEQQEILVKEFYAKNIAASRLITPKKERANLD